MTASDPEAVLVTGASGFIGRHIVAALGGRRRVIPLRVRAGDDCRRALAEKLTVGRAGVLIHAAGRAHMRDRDPAIAEHAHHRDNCELTRDLAEACVDAGVRRFVFLSTIHVVATTSAPGVPLRFDQPPAPTTAYARAKLQAETELTRLSRAGRIEVAIVRPPLVYGAGAKGNLARLAAAIEAGVPLPLARVRNRRSLMNVRDLAALLERLVDIEQLPAAPLLAADTAPVSMADLVRALAAALGRPSRLFPCPDSVLRLTLLGMGRTAMAEQLLANLEVDIGPTCGATGWRPSHGLQQGLAAFAEARSRS